MHTDAVRNPFRQFTALLIGSWLSASNQTASLGQ
jgi:hypothetical protein